MKHNEPQTGPYELNNFDSVVACDIRMELCDLGVNLEEVQASPSEKIVCTQLGVFLLCVSFAPRRRKHGCFYNSLRARELHILVLFKKFECPPIYYPIL